MRLRATKRLAGRANKAERRDATFCPAGHDFRKAKWLTLHMWKSKRDIRPMWFFGVAR